MLKTAIECVLESEDFALLGLSSDDLRKAADIAGQIKITLPSIDKKRFISKVKAKSEAIDQGLDFTLFGTSGIRGNIEDLRDNVVGAYKAKSILSYKFAYYYGKAYGIMLNSFPVKVRNKKCLNEVVLGMDPRGHSLPMAACLMEGLVEEGVKVRFLGVSTTPSGNLFANAIIITASHNPLEQDGIKAFIEKRPATFEMERIVESILRVLEDLENEGRGYLSSKKQGRVESAVCQMRSVYAKEMLRYLKESKLINVKSNKVIERKLSGTLTPFDAAYGAAAAFYDSDNNITLSPQIDALLKTGTVLCGYGALRDGKKTNHGIGAAYIYGETEQKITRTEIEAFAKGGYGYGVSHEKKPHPRSFFFGNNYRWKNSSLKNKGVSLKTGETVFLFADHDPRLAIDLENEISTLILLPAISVDCDADRYLATDADLAKEPIPYLSGDVVMALFAHYYAKKINKIIFTVESGMTLTKILEKRGKDFEIVTVGDRAIADWIYDCDKKLNPAGGEPSGHVIFKGGKDDPVYTHILLLGILCSQKKSLAKVTLSEIMQVATLGIKEIYTDRTGTRPKSVVLDGITLAEKPALELKLRGKGKRIELTSYAKVFIPFCVKLWANGWKSLFAENADIEITYAGAFKSLSEKGLDKIASPYQLIPVAEIKAGRTVISTVMRVTPISYFGPSDITLVFFEKNGAGRFVCGEMVSRNSGTSPKNSCYIKMWNECPSLEKVIPFAVVERKLKELGRARADFTSKYILERRY